MNMFSDKVFDNFKDSLLYSIGFTELLLKNQKPVLTAETLIQIIRDAYFLKNNILPQTGVCNILTELSIEITENESIILKNIEKSLRKEEEYIEAANDLNLLYLESILNKIKVIVPYIKNNKSV